ncbi:hypothetical protein SAMN05444920_116235 [Nonomuraea solani]|uniref:Replication initiation protein n=1 Tax=Nonomuraea solani TaxID=1144553 RepID=A0A1H6ERL7_9ACTN|nr:hypothetical protein SAMN05444920_116235 [Nonomuraea solani]
MTHAQDRALPRAVRLAMPMARDVVEEVAKLHGVCIRPVPLKRLDTHTGQWEIIDVPCGSPMDSKCPPCAKRNKQLRKAQCREGWHLDAEPTITPDEPNEEQRWLVEFRADIQGQRDEAEKASGDTTDLDAVIEGLDEEINAAGMRGNVLGRTTTKRPRSTKRRQDAPDLPKRKMAHTTLGRTFQAPDGKTYRPSLFVTLTLPSYGKIRDGAPVDPDTYDYARAARDALHFSKLVDRFVQNLRRVAGFDVQYFATVEPQKRLAPHLHMAIRGTLPRAEMKQIAAATYHQVWWPSVDHVAFEGEHLPVWQEGAGYLDPDTGEMLPTLDEALDGQSPTRPRGPFRRCPALRTLLTGLPELAPLRHPAQGRQSRDGSRPLPLQGTQARTPRLRGPPRPGLPQVVQQDPHRAQAGPPHLGLGSPRKGQRARRPAPVRLAPCSSRRRQRALPDLTPPAIRP